MSCPTESPVLQATFTVDLTYPRGLTALSNAEAYPLVASTGDGRERKFFEPTPQMSPYLLAICIGKLVSKSILSGTLMKNTLKGLQPIDSQQQCYCFYLNDGRW